MKLVAYFSAEYALSPGDEPPAFAGGLGVLATDLLMEAGAQHLPFVAVGLAYHPVGYDLTLQGFSKVLDFVLDFTNEQIHLAVWAKTFGSATIYLLDSDSDQNSLANQNAMRQPYGPDLWTMVQQQLI